MENGKNNGSLWLSVADATDRLGLSDAKATTAAFDGLREAGFIAVSREAHFSIKTAETSRARCWRLTWQSAERKAPTAEWDTYIPLANSRARTRADRGLSALSRYRKGLSARKFPVEDSTMIDIKLRSIPCSTVEDSTTAILKKPGKLPKLVMEVSTIHTAVTMGCGGSAWWRGIQAEQIQAQTALLLWLAQNGPLFALRPGGPDSSRLTRAATKAAHG